KAGGKAGAGAQKGQAKSEKITWAEQRTWRDGSPARLQGTNTAYYLTRKIVSTSPRTVMVQIDGPAGFKMWLNGEVVQTSAPPPPAPPPTPPQPGAAPGDNNAAAPAPEPEVIDIAEMMGRGRGTTGKKFRIGLRQGENEIVLKVVFPGGTGPGGRGGPPPAPKVAGETDHPVKQDEPKKVSLVGEKSAPLKTYTEENKLSPSERRQKVLREYFRSHIDPIGRILAEELTKLKDEERQLKREI